MKQNFPVRHFICYYIHVLKIQDPCSTVYSKVVFELFKLRNSRKTSVFKSTMTKKRLVHKITIALSTEN